MNDRQLGAMILIVAVVAVVGLLLGGPGGGLSLAVTALIVSLLAMLISGLRGAEERLIALQRLLKQQDDRQRSAEARLRAIETASGAAEQPTGNTPAPGPTP